MNTCRFCELEIVDGREESGCADVDWMTPDGDFGCGESPDTCESRTGSHVPTGLSDETIASLVSAGFPEAQSAWSNRVEGCVTPEAWLARWLATVDQLGAMVIGFRLAQAMRNTADWVARGGRCSHHDPREEVMSLLITVVGNRFEVSAELARRGIQGADLRSESGSTCDLLLPDRYYVEAQAWQCEGPSAPPYPIGACLCVHRLPNGGILGSRS